MSEAGGCEKLSSNEEIVNGITESLQSLHTENHLQNDKPEKQNVSVSNTQRVETSADANRNSQDDFDHDSDTKEDSEPEDYIDEEHLKDLELSLSKEEKEERFTRASELKKQGNEEFKAEKYLESVHTYTNALRICPLEFKNDRSILYANRAASKVVLKRKESAIEDCTKAIELNDGYVRAYLRRARLYEECDKLDESLADFNKVLEYDKGNKDALQAQHRLPPMIADRNEKLKAEMLGKLKDLGNLFLKPFGLSTNNFQLNQDPKSGGYSVNFQQNPN